MRLIQTLWHRHTHTLLDCAVLFLNKCLPDTDFQAGSVKREGVTTRLQLGVRREETLTEY